MENFFRFRMKYLAVFIVVMLADGMQGTHMYALYSNYKFNVATLYASGFVAGAFSSSFIGPLVDKFGRKNSAMIYCTLEILINTIEQQKLFYGLLASRVIGGITTNLLFTVFESWLVTQHRKNGGEEEELEQILQDTVIASNVSAIASGVISHYLALRIGLVGPFKGAVSCTFLALLLISVLWEENYGVSYDEKKDILQILRDGFNVVASDSKILRIGLIQGFSEGALQTFIYLWSPTLVHSISQPNYNPEKNFSFFIEKKEPAYGLIFGSFMIFGAFGGYTHSFFNAKISSYLENKFFSYYHLENIILEEKASNDKEDDVLDVITERSVSTTTTSYDESCDFAFDEIRCISSNLNAGICFTLSSILLFTPLYSKNQSSFSILLVSFFCYEFLIGLYLPSQGILRSIYLPTKEVTTIMTMLRVVVNILVAFGVLVTNMIKLEAAFIVCSISLSLAAILQFSLIEKSQWKWIIAELGFVKYSFSLKSFLDYSVSSDISVSLSDVIKDKKKMH